jgi:molybdenum cofactor guanylyltransferase
MADAVTSAVAAFILAGGKSTRMGRDKALLEYEGRILLARALDMARSVTREVRIVGKQEKFAAFAPVVEDIFRDCGPLGGIHAALRASGSELNLILAVDMPFVSAGFLQYLVAQAQAVPNAVVVVPAAGGRRQPLCAIYRRQFAYLAENALSCGEYKIDRLFDGICTRTISPEELATAGFAPSVFCNLNTPEELEAAKRNLRT